MIPEITQFSQEHQAAITVAAMWLVREAHVVWPKLVSIFPYVRRNSGVIGVAKQFFIGSQRDLPPDNHNPS